MNFRKWILGFLDGKAENLQNQVLAPLPVADPLEEEAEGLNFRTAIEAHQKWKARLQAVIDNRSSENLSLAVVSRDDQCVLGKWIHGIGGQRFGGDAIFQRLRRNHAFFHACAGTVLSQAWAGNTAESLANLRSGDYARASQEMVFDLAELYNRLSSK